MSAHNPRPTAQTSAPLRTPIRTLIVTGACLLALPALARPGPGHAEAKANGEQAWTELEAESLKHRDPPLPEASPAPAAPAPLGRATEAQPPELAQADALAAPSDAFDDQALPDDPFAGGPAAPEPMARPEWPPLPDVSPWDLPPLDRPIDLDHVDANLLGDAVLRATNDVRRRNGLRPLTGQRKLDRAAVAHAHRMARMGFFDHHDPHDPARGTPTQRARLAGVSNPFIAENIATQLALDHPSDRPVYVVDRAAGHFAAHPQGAPLPVRSYRTLGREVVARWMESPGHRRNLLSRNAVQMGSGAVSFRQHGELPTFTVVQLFQWYQPVR